MPCSDFLSDAPLPQSEVEDEDEDEEDEEEDEDGDSDDEEDDEDEEVGSRGVHCAPFRAISPAQRAEARHAWRLVLRAAGPQPSP